MDKCKVGIICAMKIEADNLLKKTSDINVKTIFGTDYYIGYIDKMKVVISICGIGKVAAAISAQTMILEFDPDLIINSGVAGALDTCLNIYDVVISDSFVQHDMDTSPLGDPKGLISGINVIYFQVSKELKNKLYGISKSLDYNTYIGRIASGDVFVNDNSKRLEINKEFNAMACDMESAAIAQVCYIAKKEYCAIRCISDNLSGNGEVDYNMFSKNAANISSNIIYEFLSK